MNVEIGTEAAQVPEKEYIIGIFLAVGEPRWNIEKISMMPHDWLAFGSLNIEVEV